MLVQQNTLALLHTFESTARHLSFTRAAEEMNLTQGAISHRIRHLEGLLGFRLFIRLTRKLALTEEGARLLATLSHSLRQINEEIEDIRAQDLRGTLHVGVAPTLGLNWLMPRLPRFQQRWPGLNVMMRVRAGAVDFNEERVDLAIYYGATRCSDLHRELLMEERLVPVCSPAYAERLGLLREPARLAKACFIHASESTDVQQLFSEWRLWCDGAGMTLPHEQRHYGFNHYQMALQAAQGGMGVAMGREVLVRSLLEQGSLVAVGGPAVAAGRNYELISPRENRERPRFRAFSDWLRSEVALSQSTAAQPDPAA